jgi:hypothetical protein
MLPPHALQMIPQWLSPFGASHIVGLQTEGGPMQRPFWQIQPALAQAPQWTVPPQPS